MASSSTSSIESAHLPAAAPARNALRPYLIFAVVVVACIVGYGVFRVLTGDKESTDDAQVAADIVPIATRVSGVVLHVAVGDNQLVKRGALIAELDAADYGAKLRQAEADLAAAKAEADAADARVMIVEASSKGGLSSARAALTGSTVSLQGIGSQIAAAQAAVTRAESDLKKAELDLSRAQALRKDDAIPAAQIDTLNSTADSERAALAQAQAQLAVAQDLKQTAQARIGEAQGRVEQSTSVDAQLKAARANAELAQARAQGDAALLELARSQLSYTKIYAAADGRVSKLAVHPGQIVQASQLITNLVPSATYVTANFKETQIGRMRAGQHAEVRVDALPGRSFGATVDTVAAGTGAQFSLIPPDNASGNFVKVVQRVPVKLIWQQLPKDLALQAGLSTDVTVDLK